MWPSCAIIRSPEDKVSTSSGGGFSIIVVEQRVDTSQLTREKDGRVHKVVVGHGAKRKKGTADEAMKISINTYKMRIPEVGDKVASRHAQKGTISYIADEEDLPFSMDGITPDIIMSPHALTTRMTCGNLLEALASKTGALKGKIQDATAFTHPTLEQISQDLHDSGWQKWDRYDCQASLNPVNRCLPRFSTATRRWWGTCRGVVREEKAMRNGQSVEEAMGARGKRGQCRKTYKLFLK